MLLALRSGAAPRVPPRNRSARLRTGVAPKGPTEEELEEARRAEERRQKLLHSDRLKTLMSLISGNTKGYYFMEWRRNVRRRRTFKFRRARLRWIYARLFERGRWLSRAFLGWWSNANYIMKRRQILIGGVMRWCLPSVSRALNRWKEWLVIKKAGKDLMQRIAKRMKNQGLAKCFASWVDLLREKEQNEERIRHVMALMLDNSKQYYFDTWRDNVRFLKEPTPQMGDEEILHTFYEVGRITVNRRPKKSGGKKKRERSRRRSAQGPTGTPPVATFLVRFGSVDAWLPGAALTAAREGDGAGRNEAFPVGALVELGSRADLQRAFEELPPGTSVALTDDKLEMCGRVGEVVTGDMGDGTLKLDFSTPGQQTGGGVGWYPAGGLRLLEVPRGSTPHTPSSRGGTALAVGARVRLRRNGRATLPLDMRAAAASVGFVGEVVQTSLGSDAQRSAASPASFGPSHGSPLSFGGSSAGSADSAGSQSSAGRGRKGRRRSRASAAERSLPALAAPAAARRQVPSPPGSESESTSGAQLQKDREADAAALGESLPESLFDMHLNRPLSRVRRGLGTHNARKAMHVLNTPMDNAARASAVWLMEKGGAPQKRGKVAGLSMRELWGGERSSTAQLSS